MHSSDRWGGAGMAAALIGAGLALYFLYQGLRPSGGRRPRAANVPPADSPMADRFLTETLGRGRP